MKWRDSARTTQLGMIMKRQCSSTVLAIVAAAALGLNSSHTRGAEPCNPVIEGTYCATQPNVNWSDASSGVSAVQMSRSGFSVTRDQPATLGAITFQGTSRCFAVLRRSVCK